MMAENACYLSCNLSFVEFSEFGEFNEKSQTGKNSNVPNPNPKTLFSKPLNIPDTTELPLSLEQMEDNNELDNPHKPKNQAKH